jgi:hypothetical protein
MSEYENQMWRNSLITNIPTEFCGHSIFFQQEAAEATEK